MSLLDIRNIVLQVLHVDVDLQCIPRYLCTMHILYVGIWYLPTYLRRSTEVVLMLVGLLV